MKNLGRIWELFGDIWEKYIAASCLNTQEMNA